MWSYLGCGARCALVIHHHSVTDLMIYGRLVDARVISLTCVIVIKHTLVKLKAMGQIGFFHILKCISSASCILCRIVQCATQFSQVSAHWRPLGTTCGQAMARQNFR